MDKHDKQVLIHGLIYTTIAIIFFILLSLFGLRWFVWILFSIGLVDGIILSALIFGD